MPKSFNRATTESHKLLESAVTPCYCDTYCAAGASISFPPKDSLVARRNPVLAILSQCGHTLSSFFQDTCCKSETHVWRGPGQCVDRTPFELRQGRAIKRADSSNRSDSMKSKKHEQRLPVPIEEHRWEQRNFGDRGSLRPIRPRRE